MTTHPRSPGRPSSLIVTVSSCRATAIASRFATETVVSVDSPMRPETAPVSSARRDELLERAYGYVIEHGLAAMSLRPLATEIGSSPRVLLFLFGSKDGLVRALLARARADEGAFLARLPIEEET